MTHLAEILIIDIAVIVALFLSAWLICMAIGDVTPVDSLWGFGLGVVAIATYLQTGGGTERRVAMTLLCAIWAARLGTYMLSRWRSHGPDGRYIRLLERAKADRGYSFAYASLTMVFLRQLPLLWLVSLPVQLGQIPDEPATLGSAGWAGLGLGVFGFFFESIADWQLVRFKKDSANAGKVMDRGLWRYTRHPNYFGDACVWFGLWLIAAETTLGRYSIIGPLFLAYTLTSWSGAPTTEPRMKRKKPDYEDYMRRTSGFFPWPPKPSKPA